MSHLKPGALVIGIDLLAHIFIFPLYGQSQGNCPNADFSQGNFSQWEGFYGDYWNPAIHAGFALIRHTIIQAPATFDINTGKELDPLPPGRDFSARLGNDIGSQAEQLRYSVDVTDETNLFIYEYAVVLSDLPHSPDYQPGFTVEVTDGSGTIIDPVCNSYIVYVHKGIPTWHSYEGVAWKEWTTAGIDLRQYTGQTTSIVFTTRDCALSIHFGYAYLSARCSKTELTFSYCPGDMTATVTAPPGFSYLWPNGDTTRSRTLVNPFIGMVDSCVLTSVTGCRTTVKDTLKSSVIVADFVSPPQGCQGAIVRFEDSSVADPGVARNWLWDFGDGSPPVTDVQNPKHIYDSAGKFIVTMIAFCDGGCPDTVTKPVEIISTPEIGFSIDSPCDESGSGDTLYFEEQVELSVAQGYDHYLWNTGGTTASILAGDEGWYRVTIDNGGICSVTDSVMLLHCLVPLIMPNAFSPNDDGLNDLFLAVVQPERITGFHMLIFDPWGGELFETDDFRQGWDGTFKGEKVPPGVYVYTLTYRYDYRETKKMTGSVTLIR